MTPTLHQTIARAVAADGRTQTAIAHAAGMTQPQLSAFLAGKRPRLRQDTLERLMAVLGLEIRPGKLGRSDKPGKSTMETPRTQRAQRKRRTDHV